MLEALIAFVLIFVAGADTNPISCRKIKPIIFRPFSRFSIDQ